MPSKANPNTCRHLVLVLGDQLNANSAAFDGFERKQDAVWMAEVANESTHVWTHKARIAIFLACMRHFRNGLQKRRFSVHYHQLDGPSTAESLAADLAVTVEELKPERLIVASPGEWRVRQELQHVADSLHLELEIRPDRHFLSSPEAFSEHAEGRKQLRLEYFYRELRRKHDVLMDGDQPEGGKWNYDSENRSSFSKSGPADLRPPRRFAPNSTTREVLELVERRFAKHPGSLANFDWPVTPQLAQAALADFVEHRLPHFGEFQDAMWCDEPYLYHSRISAALNLKLLDPREVIQAAISAYRAGHAPLSSVEGFVRQILGWREYVRGIYWRYMPEYITRNALNAQQTLPNFFWTGDTEMTCLRSAIGQTLEFGYAHHIQRLMVTGLFSLLLGVEPKAVHEWYLAMYVDAVEWVELPNSLGMSQFADGGVMASKPYAATGKYIQRMSNYCDRCPFDPGQATGESACPFTTLYWDFLARHRKRLQGNQRMAMQLRNLDRKGRSELIQIRKQADQLRSTFAST